MLLNGLLAFFWLSLSGAGCLDPCADRTDQAYLNAAAQEEGALRTESGMVFRELKEGYGPTPGDGDVVQVHYKAMLTSGKVFDYSRRRPSTLPMEKVIPGWAEALKMMKGGGKARIVLPPALAYGRKGKPGTVPQCAVLVFEIELVGIESAGG